MNILNNGLFSILTSSSDIGDGVIYYAILIGFIFISVAISYLLGSINSAIIISRIFYGEDVRTKGSGNAGLTNMIRNYGKKGALFTLLGDVTKAALAILCTALLLGFNYQSGIALNGYCYLAGVFVAIGHIFPIYYKFKGGKGVLVTAITALILTPVPALILIFMFAVIFAISRYVSLGSITVATLYPIVAGLYVYLTCGIENLSALLLISLVLFAVIIVWCHRENVKRLLNGTENKLSFKKKD